MKKILTITLALTLIFFVGASDDMYAKKKAKAASTECKFVDKNKDGKCDKFVDNNNNGKCDKCGDKCDGTKASCQSSSCCSSKTVTPASGGCSSTPGTSGCSSKPGHSCSPATKTCSFTDANKDAKCDKCQMTEAQHKAQGCPHHK